MNAQERDPRTPVIIGVGQIKQQLRDNYDAAKEQVQLMEDVVRLAAADCEADTEAVLSSIDRIGVVGGLWAYKDPGRQVADAVGSPQADSVLTYFGGNMPQALVAEYSRAVQAGECDLAVALGGEAVYSRRKMKAAGSNAPCTQPEGMPDAVRFGSDLEMSSEHERQLGLDRPPVVYAMFESAIRADAGRPVDEHLIAMSELWQGFNEVAVENPIAWVRNPMTAEEIRTATPSNRMVNWPYTKSMNANPQVDQAAAVIVCSVEKATDLGVPQSQWVFPHSATQAHATMLFSERDNYHSSPAIRIAGKKALEMADAAIEDIAHFDLYSCFPSVVQITVGELGIPADRQLTSTGGLGFFGGPLNNYVMHGIASLIEKLRANPGDLGLLHANGGYATKQAFGVYGTTAPVKPFEMVDVQAEVDATPRREVDTAPSGVGVIEAYVLPWEGDGPARAILTAIMADDRRAIGVIDDPAVLQAMLTEDFVGRTATLQPDGSAVIATP